MREISMGEMRYLEESANAWKMEVYGRLKKELTDEEETKIKEMARAYVEAFSDYYKNAIAEDENRDTYDIQSEFDEVYEKEHPEFYDIDALIS